MLARTGNTHSAANPSTTRGTAKPESVTDRPNKVSVGRLLCSRIAAAKANGLITHAARTRRTFSCANSFDHSTPATVTDAAHAHDATPIRAAVRRQPAPARAESGLVAPRELEEQRFERARAAFQMRGRQRRRVRGQ